MDNCIPTHDGPKNPKAKKNRPKTVRVTASRHTTDQNISTDKDMKKMVKNKTLPAKTGICHKDLIAIQVHRSLNGFECAPVNIGA